MAGDPDPDEAGTRQILAASGLRSTPATPSSRRRRHVPAGVVSGRALPTCRVSHGSSLLGQGGHGEGGAYSAGVLIVGSQGLWHVADVIRGQWSIHKRNAIIEQTAAIDHDRFGDGLTIVVEQEPGSAGKESAQHTISQLAGYHVRADKVTGSKEIRAQPFADQCEAGNVRLVRGAWNRKFVEEAEEFPLGDYLDQIDAAAGAFAFCRPAQDVCVYQPAHRARDLRRGRIEAETQPQAGQLRRSQQVRGEDTSRPHTADVSELMQQLLTADEDEDAWHVRPNATGVA